MITSIVNKTIRIATKATLAAAILTVLVAIV